MYEIGQLIVYGNEGVCRVEEIGTPKISGVDKHREYYTLAPIYREGKVFTPVDSKVFMRPVITREEALALIDRIPQMTAQVYENSNLRFLNEHYQQCIQDYTCADLLQLIKDVRAKRRRMAERGKKLGLVDERYMKRAEEMLHGELAIALDMPREQVPVLMFGRQVAPRSLGRRASYADLGQSIAAFLDIAPLAYGESFLK